MSTRPGLHPDTNLSQYPRDIAKIVLKISSSFYVTRTFHEERIGNSEYWAILARPADDFSVHLNADREILFLFAGYRTFEIRTLEAYEEFFAQLAQKRVDKAVRFLVSNDERIEDIVRHYLNQNPEYPIIVPIHFSDFDVNPDCMLDALRRNYVLRDLFGYQNPLREETFFFGRQELVNSVLDLAKSGQSSSIFGLRKSGKTSTIFAIQRKAKSFGVIPVTVDCQNPIAHSGRYDSLLAHIVTEVRAAIGQSKKIEALGNDPVEVAENFRLEMKTAVGQAKRNIIILFDEIENISPQTAASRHWTEDDDPVLFWQNIRSYVQADSKGKMALCLVGTSPKLLELDKINDIANPMYLFSQKRFIPGFSFDETREMIEKLGYFMGLEFDATQISDLHRRYGGHPFFVRQVCSHVHQQSSMSRPKKVSNSILKRAMEQFGGQLDSYLGDIVGSLRTLYPGEYDLLEAVALGRKDEINEFGREAPELIDHLTGYGVVEKRDGDFEIRFQAIENALKRVLQLDSQDKRREEISRRRNRVEGAIRVELLHWAKGVEGGRLEDILKKNLTNRRFEGLSSIEPRALFSKSKSELYFSDLICILRSEEVLPYLAERRSPILRSMDQVNKLRADAHAKHVGDVELTTIRGALDILEMEFEDI